MIQPLDLQTLLVNTLSGNWYIFAALMLIVIAGLAAKFKMSNMTFGLIVLIFAAIMSSYLPWLVLLALIVLSFILYQNIKKIISPN